MLNRKIAEAVVKNIKENHAFDPKLSVPFKIAEATGYIPISHLDTYLNQDDFIMNGENLNFAPHVQGFDAKTQAMNNVTEALIANGLIEKSTEPHFQERAIGHAEMRTQSPTSGEFKINRAYYRHYGFEADTVCLLVILENKNQPPCILLQKRAARVETGGTFDFAASGAVKYPQTVLQAVNKQALEEIGVDISAMKFMGATSFKFQTPEKDWVTSNRHHLFDVRTNAIQIGDFDKEEVAGFETATPEQVVEYCANERINRQNIQSMMTSLIAAGLMPEFDGADLIRDAVKVYYEAPTATQSVAARPQQLRMPKP